MNDYQSLYTWAMERQMSLREEAELRRMVRQARQAGLPTDPLTVPRLRVLPGEPAVEEPATQQSA